MATSSHAGTPTRVPLSRPRVLEAAIALADGSGVDGLSMRKLAQELGVVPMALYKHVANKDELLDGMIDVVIGEIDPPAGGADWKAALRQRVLSARQALLRHPWAAHVIESRSQATPAVLVYMDSIIGMFRAGGFSVDLTHHAMHAMGSRLLGFSQQLFDDSGTFEPEMEAVMLEQMAPFPHIAELVAQVFHDQRTVVGGKGCDDQFEFEFALDLMLDGLERQRESYQETSHRADRGTAARRSPKGTD
jgi:AcrR family transcriptional regulator